MRVLSGAGDEGKMKLRKGFIDAISRDYMKFLMEEAGKSVCLEKIMEQADKFEDVQICTRKHMFSPYEFALAGGRDSDIKEVRYGKNDQYGYLFNIICHVEDGELSLVTFDVSLCDGSRIENITMNSLYEQWCDTRSGFFNELIEVFEEFLNEHNIDVLNDEKADAIRAGEDVDSVANIYGADYGWLQDELGKVLGISCCE